MIGLERLLEIFESGEVIGKDPDVINSGCKFQDQGGISIGDMTFIGHNVVLATLDHDLDPEHRF